MKNLFLAFAFLATFSLQAQTSKEILDKLSTKAKAWATTSSDFSSELSNPKTGKVTKQNEKDSS